MEVAYGDAVLTPCRDVGNDGCASRCPFDGEPRWVDFHRPRLTDPVEPGLEEGWFHVTPLDNPERASAKGTHDAGRTTGGFQVFVEFGSLFPRDWAPKPSEPGTTIPPELNP